MSNCCSDQYQNSDTSFSDYHSQNIYNWCTNCGNYGIAAATKRALVSLNIKPKDTVMVFDIGCNGNGSDKIGGYRYHGLHGRAIPFAAGAALANRNITVIASGGDGGTLSEGINHLVHAIRSNYNFTFLLHNNSNYGLTKGQASASTRPDIPMNSSPDGTTADTLNVMNFVINLGASFAARTFSGDVNQMTEIIKQGILHKGFSIIEILQNCPTYNKATPHEWYQERVFDTFFEKDYDPTNYELAMQISRDLDNRIATGIIYQNKNSLDFYARQQNRKQFQTELVEEVNSFSVDKLFQKFS